VNVTKKDSVVHPATDLWVRLLLFRLFKNIKLIVIETGSNITRLTSLKGTKHQPQVSVKLYLKLHITTQLFFIIS